jgi:hypothetical protein
MNMADKPHDQPMDAAEHAALRTWLEARGLTHALVVQALGNSPGNKTRQQHSDSLIAVLKTLPHS